jgi:hypothetical protein
MLSSGPAVIHGVIDLIIKNDSPRYYGRDEFWSLKAI